MRRSVHSRSLLYIPRNHLLIQHLLLSIDRQGKLLEPLLPLDSSIRGHTQGHPRQVQKHPSGSNSQHHISLYGQKYHRHSSSHLDNQRTSPMILIPTCMIECKCLLRTK
jgi:hypothetical protein